MKAIDSQHGSITAVSIEPWSPYPEQDSLVSNGRRTLVSVFSDLVACQAGFRAHELAEIFEAPEDEGENDFCRDLVRADALMLTRQFVLGKIARFARPIGGGDVVDLPPERWEIDDPVPRFATGALNLLAWADPAAPPTHRILVDSNQFDEWLAGLRPPGPLSNRQVEEIIDPQLRATRSVASKRIEAAETLAAPSDNAAAKPAFEAAGLGPELLKMPEVVALTRRGRSTIYTMIGEEKFPEQIKVGSSSYWSKREVLVWIEEQAARRGD